MDQNEKSRNSIKVIARFKPSSNLVDFSSYSDKIKIYENSVVADNKTFNFEGIANTETSQENFFNTYIKSHILKVEDGTNSSVLCYGFTGSGKTYTLFGRDGDDSGIVYRSIHSIFELMKEKSSAEVNYSLNVSMVEIYMEKIYDLIDSKNIFIGVSGTSGLIGATKLNISTEQELINVITMASEHRKTQDTRLNSFSSRSHCIIIIQLKKYHTNGTEKCGNLYLVDLAGCERITNYSNTLSAEDDNIKRIIKNTSLVDKLKFANTLGSEINKTLVDESKNINKSIFELNNVVTACSSGQKFIPYRNSKITMVLKDALGGNSNTLITICCSDILNETLMTLRFGSRCKKIKNTIKNNIVEKDTRDILIIKLQSEISDLKDLLEISKKNMEAATEELKNKMPNASSSSRYPYSTFSTDQDTKRSIEPDYPDYNDTMCDKLVNKIFGDLIKDPTGLDINQSIQLNDSPTDSYYDTLDTTNTAFKCLNNKKTIKLKQNTNNIIVDCRSEDSSLSPLSSPSLSPVSSPSPVPLSESSPTPASDSSPAPASDSSPAPASDSSPASLSDSSPASLSDSSPVPASDSAPVPVDITILKKVENVEFSCCRKIQKEVEKVIDVVIEAVSIPSVLDNIPVQTISNSIQDVLTVIPIPDSVKNTVNSLVVPFVENTVKSLVGPFVENITKNITNDIGSFSEEVGCSDTESYTQNSIRSQSDQPSPDLPTSTQPSPDLPTATPPSPDLPKATNVGKSFCC